MAAEEPKKPDLSKWKPSEEWLAQNPLPEKYTKGLEPVTWKTHPAFICQRCGGIFRKPGDGIDLCAACRLKILAQLN